MSNTGRGARLSLSLYYQLRFSSAHDNNTTSEGGGGRCVWCFVTFCEKREGDEDYRVKGERENFHSYLSWMTRVNINVYIIRITTTDVYTIIRNKRIWREESVSVVALLGKTYVILHQLNVTHRSLECLTRTRLPTVERGSRMRYIISSYPFYSSSSSLEIFFTKQVNRVRDLNILFFEFDRWISMFFTKKIHHHQLYFLKKKIS